MTIEPIPRKIAVFIVLLTLGLPVLGNGPADDEPLTLAFSVSPDGDLEIHMIGHVPPPDPIAPRPVCTRFVSPCPPESAESKLKLELGSWILRSKPGSGKKGMMLTADGPSGASVIPRIGQIGVDKNRLSSKWKISGAEEDSEGPPGCWIEVECQDK